jgi:flavodoxin
MKSTIVIYGHESELTKANAKRIAFLLGAQTTCTRHIGEAIMNGVENIVLCLPSLNAEGAEREWQEFIDTFRSMNLTGKSFAIYVPSDNPDPNRLNDLKYVLYQRNAKRIINQSVDIQHYSVDDWICAISPSL